MFESEICLMTTKEEMDERGYVHWKSWHETYSNLMPRDYLDGVTLEKCVKTAHKFPQNTILLKVDNKVVGFSCLFKGAEGINEIVALYLLKEYHGKKLGYKLLKHTFSELVDSSKIVLWVLKGNDRAISFYKKFGFEFNGIEKQLPFGVELQMEMNI